MKKRTVLALHSSKYFTVDLRNEIRPRATPELSTTMYQDGNDTCLYGVCHYCSPVDPVCGTGDILEGALISWLPRYLRLVKHRHPWQRTYKKNKLATWETDEGYCEKVWPSFMTMCERCIICILFLANNVGVFNRLGKRV